MSDVCGIFSKTCPQCATTLAKSASACDCGYSYIEETSTSALAQTLAEEKLYEDYLLARVTQTAQAAIDAQAQQKGVPADAALRSAALAAVELAEAARRDLAAQSARVEELRAAMASEATAVAVAKPAIVVTVSAVSTAQPTARIAATPKEDRVATMAEASAPAGVRAAEVARAAEALRNELTKLRQATPQALPVARVLRPTRGEAARAVAPTSVPPHANADADKAVAAKTAGAEGGVRTHAASVPNPVAAALPKKRCPECDAAVIATAHRCRCGFVFVTAPMQPATGNVPKIEDVLARAQELKQARRESAQAEKAARIREARLARAAKKPAAPKSDIAPVPALPTATESLSPNTGTAVEVAVPVKTSGTAPAIAAEKPLRQLSASHTPARPLATVAARDVKECPNCTATLATHVSRCKCGFEFRDTAHNVMPGLRLDDGELLKVQDLYVRR